MLHRVSIRSTLGAMLGLLTLAVVATAWSPPVAAQEVGAPIQEEASAPAALAPLPADRRTAHVLSLPDRILRLTATAGFIPIHGPNGDVAADVAFTAYTLDGAEARTRPIAFAFNGGPGSASTWLHLGGMGPWRVPLTAATIAARTGPALVDNAETWLDFTDLVFIDPPGTGFSRIRPGPAGGASSPRLEPGRGGRGERPPSGYGTDWFWSIGGDIATFATFISAWTRRMDRAVSPVVLVGESYGGFRTPLIAEALGRHFGTTVRAMVLVSPVLDFDGRRGGHLPQYYVAMLPSLAATRLERSGVTPTRAALAEAEEYARGAYLVDLARGTRDTAAVDRIAARVSEFTGLSIEHVRLQHGRISSRFFIRDGTAGRAGTMSLYDAGMMDLESSGPPSRGGGYPDPFTRGLGEPLMAAMGLLHARLQWNVDRPYILTSSEANRRWHWRNSPHSPESLSTLSDLHRKDQRLRTLVTHGFTDLVTPYFAAAMQLDQIHPEGPESRIKLEVYTGGHMHYSRDGTRARLHADAEQLLGEVLRPGVR